MNTKQLKEKILAGQYDARFYEVYDTAQAVTTQKRRYEDAIEAYRECYGDDDVAIFSAPGRTEIGGNHTDHQNGEVLAASVSADMIAVASPTLDGYVEIVSDGYPKLTFDVEQIEMREEEKGSSVSLVKGMLAGIKERGYRIGGFRAYITSDILSGSGLSSSAAYEVLIGTIVSGFYNELSIVPEEIAKIGQFAENHYFGKPCGLMDQMACAVGAMVHIDFRYPESPEVKRIEFDLKKQGYALCITDTKGSHAELTQEYAAIPNEMKAIAGFFGETTLVNISLERIINSLQLLREKYGDRAVLRALHFVMENERVRMEADALLQDDFPRFLRLVKESGDSSFKYLQNVYVGHAPKHQNISLALAVGEAFTSDNLSQRIVSRVHGGGFAGTIQSFVPCDLVSGYKDYMDHVFGKGACEEYRIRKHGAIKVM
nr:galactokinase [Lachnospiraceae bacterium]